jgi:dipeptidyl aminopeptidase/acylaminoacyl peptidase
VGVLTFYVNNSSYVKGKVEVKGPKNYRLFIDGVEAGGELKLAPEHHTFAIRYLAEPNDTDSIRVTLDTQLPVEVTADKRHPYMVHDLTDGKRVRGVAVSPQGRYVCVSYQTTERGGNSRWDYELCDVKTGRVLSRPTHNVRWMPKTEAWLEEVREGGQRVLYKVSPLTGERTRWAAGLPDGSYTVSPTEDYLIITASEEGPKEDPGVFEVVEMDDRQPGWRSRSYLVKFDVQSGVSQRITFGSKGQSLSDISQDGTKLLIVSSYSRLAKRPTEVEDIYLMDARTLKVDTVLQCEGFLGSAQFSPDATQLLIGGTPEAFDRIGCQLPANVTPSMTENELFLYDLATKQVTPLTKDFDPSPDGSADWSWADGMVYFRAECRDYVYLYQLNPKTGKTVQVPVKGDDVYRFDMAAHAPVLAYLSYNTMEPASAYVVTLSGKSGKSGIAGITLFDGKTALGDAEVGTCEDWNFTNSHGDTVYGRLYKPKDFDASKKYPMIVYYYGGCSPVSRYFESPYAPQYWNSLGYVAYILQPSGATGFGQEWASRHVNTAGGLTQNATTSSPNQGGTPAGDIIEGVKKICAEHPFIDATKVGCMGASYGGFMTQYLQTVTDIFAAAVSHAGITNHTSYWGEGYWGYNYSEVSMANSYPWSHRQLYVDQSPLFNADKIHTPLLLLHGNADTNVPLIESLQMFTALKLLGREVALVEVTGENHHIQEYAKKEKWLATQMAWFQKWLKGDPTWWDALYPKKHL